MQILHFFVATLALGAALEVLFNQTKAERDKRWSGRFVLCGSFGWSHAECDDVCRDVLPVMATLRGSWQMRERGGG